MAKETDPLSDHPFPLNLSLDLDSGTDAPMPALGLDDLASPQAEAPQPAPRNPQPDLRAVQELAQLIELTEDESPPVPPQPSAQPSPDPDPALDEPLEAILIEAPTEGELVVVPQPRKGPSLRHVAPRQAQTAEVSGLRHTTQSGTIALSWQPPAKAKGIEVWRQDGSPPERGQGVLVDHVTLTDARDPGLYNGKRYGYRVVAVFDGPDGEPVYSAGVTCIACPGDPPPPGPATGGELSLGQLSLFGGIALLVFLVVAALGNTLGFFGSRSGNEKPAAVARARETPPPDAQARTTPPEEVEAPVRKLALKPRAEAQPPAPAPVPVPAAKPGGEPPPAVLPAPSPSRGRSTRVNPIPEKPRVAPLEGEEALLLDYPPADQKQWDQAWRRNLKVHVTLKMSGRVLFGQNQNKALPTVVGLQSISLENQSPCLIRVVGGPAKSLESTSRKRLDILPERSLWLSDPHNHPVTMSIDLRMQAERNGVVAAVRRGPLCTIEVVPSNGQEPLRFLLEYAFTVNRDNDVLSARYILSGVQ